MDQDDTHLRLLSIFHYVVGGLTGLFALFPIFHLIFGLLLIFAPDMFDGPEEFPAALMGWLFVVVPAVIITVGWILAGCMIAAGRFLAQRRRYLFCLVMAGIECIIVPFGTVLGVFTIIVLMRESVRRQFEATEPLEPGG